MKKKKKPQGNKKGVSSLSCYSNILAGKLKISLKSGAIIHKLKVFFKKILYPSQCITIIN